MNPRRRASAQAALGLSLAPCCNRDDDRFVRPDASGARGRAFGGGRPRDEAAESRAHNELRNRLFGAPQLQDGVRYRIDRRVGVGGAGEVYEAWDRELKRRVAMKVLRPASESDPMDTRARERLMREAQTIAQLSHSLGSRSRTIASPRRTTRDRTASPVTPNRAWSQELQSAARWI